MNSLVRRFFEWMALTTAQRLALRASEYGRLSLQQTEFENYVGWHCSIRWMGTGPRYAWTGTGATIEQALGAALSAAKEEPVMKTIVGAPCAPKLGGAEFDPE